jgi:hypothetical protein
MLGDYPLPYTVYLASNVRSACWMTQHAVLCCAVLCCAVLCCAVLQLRCEYDVKGQLVFRGPRLRIGVCEGVPRTVMPDHLGR